MSDRKYMSQNDPGDIQVTQTTASLTNGVAATGPGGNANRIGVGLALVSTGGFPSGAVASIRIKASDLSAALVSVSHETPYAYITVEQYGQALMGTLFLSCTGDDCVVCVNDVYRVR